jgi:hypothetical protein
MTPAEKLLDPAAGGAIAAARAFGIDLSLNAERLRRTPEERLRDLEQASNEFEQIRGAARRSYAQAQGNPGSSGRA